MLDVSINNGIAEICMQHGKVNAMSLEFVREMNRVLESCADEPNVQQTILCGNGRIFSAGVDLKRVVEEGNEYLDDFLPALVKMFLLAFEFPKPLIAAINGHAVAGGCVLACAADYRVISDRARIGVPELRVGVPFPSSGMEIMRWATTPQAFRKMINTGATYVGDEAVTAGLADEAAGAEELMNVARQALEPFSVVPPDVFRLTKRQMRRPVRESIDRGSEVLGQEINQLWRAPETRAAVTAYVNERLK